MGKRKHKDKNSNSRARKKRKHEKRARRRYDSDTYSSSSTDEYSINDWNIRQYSPNERFTRNYDNTSDSNFEFPLSDLEMFENEQRPKSVIANNTTQNNLTAEYDKSIENIPQPGPSLALVSDNIESTSIEVPTESLPSEILEALGDPKGKEEVFGPTIPEEIAKRWGRVLVDGLTKEQKQDITEKSLIPDNFRLAKAPLLNPEIIPVLSDSARNRDKLLEKSQNQLGIGIARLTNLASSVIKGNTEKIDLLKQISETSQIFLDLHHEDTNRRRKLVTSSLDKKFLNMISDVKRDTHLFGANLGEKIKATKTAERSGLQIKRTDTTGSSSKKYPHQGNWRGPPRTQAPRAYRSGGQKNRYWSQTNRRPPPPPARQSRAPATIPATRSSKKQ